MNVIKELIGTMNSSEKRGFVRYLEDRNRRKDVRNITLFASYDNRTTHRLRTEMGTNAFNVAKKRLRDRLLEYMGNSAVSTEVSEEISIIKQLVLSRKLFAHGNTTLAFTLLHRAEKGAQELQHHSLLNEILQTSIHYSYLPGAQEQQELFKKLEDNRGALHRQQQLTMAHAIIRKAFNDKEFRQGDIDLNTLLHDTYAQLGIGEEEWNNFQSLYQLVQIADVTAFEHKNYYLVDLYFKDQVEQLTGTPGDSEKMLIYHIDTLYLIANIYFRQRKFTESLSYLKRMKEQMQRYNCKFELERNIQWSTLQALNLNFTGNYSGALDLLNNLINAGVYPRQELLNPILTRIMIQFQQGQLEVAQEEMMRLNHSDHWYEQHMGQEWMLNKKYIEILLNIELGNTAIVDSRILSLTRKYGQIFSADKRNPVIPFLKLVQAYDHDPSIVATEDFKLRVEQSIPWKQEDQEDIFLMSFYAWLKSKMEKRCLYEVTLELVRL